jgi:hypothetical protein
MFLLLSLCRYPGTAPAAGPFGPPEPFTEAKGGIHTAIGYTYKKDCYENGVERIFTQNIFYSELGRGFARYFELYGRFGIADLEVGNVTRISDELQTSEDFNDNWQFTGTLGVKGYYPLSEIFGVGAFLQGTYSFGDYRDDVRGTFNGVAFTSEYYIENPWDVNAGIALQAHVTSGIKVYTGAYLYHSEAKISLLPYIPESTLKNETRIGGFAGFNIPIGRGFQLNLESQFAKRVSAGMAIVLVH